jgi:ATPase family associated with various cellular activities (AAA)
MTITVPFEVGNADYLAAGLAWLRERLGIESQAEDSSPYWIDPRWSELAFPPALELLGDRFALSRFERLVLLLACAAELDPHLASGLASAGREPYPTFALALEALPDPAWDVVAPHGPLRFWRLVEIHRVAGEPLVLSRLTADERIVNFVKGLNVLDDRVAQLMEPPADVLGSPLPPSHQRAVDGILAGWSGASREERAPLIQLAGRDATVRRGLAARAAKLALLDLHELPSSRIPGDTTELLRLWRREAVLLPLALYVDLADVAPEEADAALQLIEAADGAVLAGVREPLRLARRRARVIETARPTAGEQEALWRAVLEPDSGNPAELADAFDLDQVAIHDVAQGGGIAAEVWEACRARTRPRVDALAQRIEPIATWEDLVLPSEGLALLHRVVEQVRGRGKVLRDWGFAERIRRGTAITALFAGHSGTGKTLAAEVVAHELELDLYRIDLAGVVSKYIGETERNLRRVFDAADEGGSLLLFDEADALFGKRSEVKDSHDRYANIEINYLLQRMEDYRGVAILATNRREALDEAFLRRLRFVVTFPFPSRLEREALWSRAFPARTPTRGLDFERLADLAATGGMIRNIALNAAGCAAGNEGAVTMDLILEMARAEFRKLQLPVADADFLAEVPA